MRGWDVLGCDIVGRDVSARDPIPGLFAGPDLIPPWFMLPRLSNPPALGGRGTDREAIGPRSCIRPGLP
jgi:hypothetical protein